MLNTLWINANHGRDFHPLADHMTKLRHLTMGEIREFLVFPFSLQLMFDKKLSNLIGFLMIFTKLYTNVAKTS